MTMLRLSPTDLIIASGILSGVAFIVYYIARSRRLPLPPGPRPKFLSGNTHQLPRADPWKTFRDWSKEYGSPLVYYRVFGKETIVLNTLKAATDLLESRASIYSDRPHFVMYQELMNRKYSMFHLTSQSPRFKIYRRMLQSSLNPRAVQKYRGIQRDERVILLKGLLTSPEQFVSHLRRNAGAVILKVSYGWSVADENDYLLTIIEEGIRISAQALRPGRWLVDSIPQLKYIPEWFPGAGFKTQARKWREHLSQLDMFPHSWVKQQMMTGDYIESFNSQHMHPEDGHIVTREEEDIIKWVSVALYAGGADTTVAALSTFILLMTVYPEVQRRAQAEVDSVIGPDRLPTADDLSSLPYIAAVFKEVQRFGPVAPVGLPHRVIQEDTYMGYRIPKGATVISNIWAMLHDPEIYPEPFKFDPDRFLGKEPQLDSRKIAFGFGRRVCPGAHFAENTSLLNMASILAIFDILKPLDKDGKEYDPPVDFTSDTIASHPKPFMCRLKPRSEQSVNLLEAQTQ